MDAEMNGKEKVMWERMLGPLTRSKVGHVSLIFGNRSGSSSTQKDSDSTIVAWLEKYEPKWVSLFKCITGLLISFSE